MSAPPPPSGEARPAGFPAALAGVVAVTLILRLLLGGAVHLAEDEAYYRLWSMAPAFGYYDHPPMIAWWVWLGRRLAGDSPLGVRLAPILATAATSVLIFDLARLAGADRRTAERAGVWYNATLLVAAGGFLAVPDAPAAFFWVLTIWCALKAANGASISWWLGAGAAAGLAVLSKYSALFLGPGILLWLALTPGGRRSLRTPGPWLALAVAGSLFALNLAWNADHHWLTIAKQFGRVAVARLALRYLVEFVATQIVLFNPLIALFLVRLAGRRRRGEGEGANPTIFLATSAPFIGYLLLHSLHDRVQAHWPAPVYPALAICAAMAASGVSRSGPWKALRTAAPIFGFAACAAALVLVVAPPIGGFDPALPLRGWPTFARNLDAARIRAGAAWVGTASYGLDAELADDPGLRAPIVQLAERERYRGLALGPAPDFARPGLTIDLPRRIDIAALRACFAQVTPLGALVRGGSRNRPGKTYQALLVSGPRRDILRDGCVAATMGPASSSTHEAAFPGRRDARSDFPVGPARRAVRARHSAPLAGTHPTDEETEAQRGDHDDQLFEIDPGLAHLDSLPPDGALGAANRAHPLSPRGVAY